MKQKTILFLDNTYPEPYQLSTLDEKAIGGTEASICRTALILSKKYRVYVAQKSRNHTKIENQQLSFIPKTEMPDVKADYVIVLRKSNQLKIIQKLFPKARIFLWLHTYKNYEYALKRIGFLSSKTELICNSKTHKDHTNDLIHSTYMGRFLSVFFRKTRVHFCYNPIDKPTLQNSYRDLNKLMYLSSPNKGLDQVIECFRQVRKKLPKLELYIANPGYKTNESIQHDGQIHYLGSLPHHEIMQQLSESLCLFYPQDTFAETFGLIYAESHAHGTAIIAHDIGAAKEIMNDNNPPINVNNRDLIVETIKNWQTNYPQLTYSDKFSDAFVFNQWQNIFRP